MWPDRVSNPGPPTYESGALPIALRGPAHPAMRSVGRIVRWEGIVSLAMPCNHLFSTRLTFKLLYMILGVVGWCDGAG